jgi:valyl-tRNA synthetase
MLPKAYDPSDCEDRIYKMWEDAGAFKPEACDPKGESFTVSMPPPNATGQLHLGHAVMLALEDIFIRFNRMRGKRALWVPGTDHAAIATESVVIKLLKQEGMADPRKQLGREKLVAKIAEFVEKSKKTIRSQIRKMGSSCDWSRERYTFEPSLNRCVNEVFCKMKNDGLIYRGHRIVNWDPKLQTTVSDDEIVYEERHDPYYTFQYGPFQISTARPETKFGDKYVVMHPDDKRYAKYKDGDTFECEWINGKIRATVIKDPASDPTFGTGVMTITPWHDHVDFALAERHGLEKEQIIDFDGCLLPVAGEFAGMHIDEARPKVVEKLKEKGLLVSVKEDYVHNVAVSQRGHGMIEPQIKLQWFIDVNKEVVPWPEGPTRDSSRGAKKQTSAGLLPRSLKQIMHSVIHHGDIQIIPERFNKTYFHWIDNLRDWCISRQIWWGHRIPVFYCPKCGEAEGAPRGDRVSGIGYQGGQKGGLITSVKSIEECPHCGGKVEQDQDTLDTWFSSAMWTWSTLVDPKLTGDASLSLEEILKRSPDYQTFHPTSVMETGYDILFFWVARMILMTTYATGQIPFKTVYLHGLIRTRDGRKMSKSDPETMIDPLDMIAKYGADALRLSMIVGQSPGNDSRLYEEKIAGYRNFINKIWNASRFVLMQCEQAGVDPKKMEKGKWKIDNLSIADQALLCGIDRLIVDVTKGLEEYRLSDTGDRLYSFVWDFYCDWYLELSKGEANCAVLVHGLRTILQLLHPYCPYVTEELWAQVADEGSPSLIIAPWPKADKTPKEFVQAFDQLQVVIDVITSIRSLRAEQNVEAGKKVTVTIHSKKHCKLLESQRSHIERMSHVGTLVIDAKPAKHEKVASAFLKDVEVHLSLEGLFDVAKLKASLENEQAELSRYIAGLQGKLGNKNFVDRAPKEVVAAEKAKLAEAEAKLKKVEERMKEVG